MKITIITLFPEMFNGFFQYSIIKKAINKKLIQIEFINPRKFTTDSYKTVDDKPYGGGAGMLLMAEPIYKAIKSIKFQAPKNKIQTNFNDQTTNLKQKIILTAANGKLYSQQKAQQYSKLNHLVIIAGHYEGVDERITNYIDEEISIGDYILSGGEIAAALIIDSVVRLIPNVIKNKSILFESFIKINIDDLIKIVGEDKYLKKLKQKNIKEIKLLEYPQYTRPENFLEKKVPQILLSGNHQQIKNWRIKQAYIKTIRQRPDLLDLDCK